MDKLPCIGVVQIFCVNTPKIDFEFEGVASAPGLEDLLKDGILSAIKNMLVLPNKFVARISDDDAFDVSDMSSMAPKGVFRIQCLQGTTLAGANWEFGDVERFYSNVYPSYVLGGDKPVRGDIVRDACDPVYIKDSVTNTANFLVMSPEQEFTVLMNNAPPERWMHMDMVTYLGETE